MSRQLTLLLFDRDKSLHFGYFHKLPHEKSADQFKAFCKATEYPPGIHEYTVTQILANEGGSLIAIDGRSVCTLIQRDLTTGVISGEERVIDLFMKPTDTLRQ